MTPKTDSIPLKEKIFSLKNEIGKMEKEKDNPFFKSKYFDINQILDRLKPLEEKYRISVTQPLSNLDGRIALALVIEDMDSDEKVVNVCPLIESSDAQKMGSTITYYRRYQLVSFFEIEAEDDDGNRASGKSEGKPAVPVRKGAAKATAEEISKAKEALELGTDPEELKAIWDTLSDAAKVDPEVRQFAVGLKERITK